MTVKKKIEFINRVEKTKVYSKEAVYFAFPFAMDHPEFRYEIQNGFVNPARDIMKGGSLEWFSVHTGSPPIRTMSSVAVVPVDAHLVTLGDIVRGSWPREFGNRKGTIFSYLMSNYWETNWPAGQGGASPSVMLSLAVETRRGNSEPPGLGGNVPARGE